MTHLTLEDVTNWLKATKHPHHDASSLSYSSACEDCFDTVNRLYEYITQRYGDYPYAKPGTESMRD